MSEEVETQRVDLRVMNIGLLGATSPLQHGPEYAKGQQIAMIERRILRIEKALRRAGIEVESIGENHAQ